MRDRWTALAAVVATAALTAALASVQVPFVVWSPGGVFDLYGAAGVKVTAPEVFPTSGRLLVPEVATTPSSISLGKALAGFFDGRSKVMPQSVQNPVGQPVAQVPFGKQPPEAQRAAEAAAVRLTPFPLTRAPRVVSVLVTGPSYGRLLPGDVITGVGATSVSSVAEFNQAVATYGIGETVQLAVTRNGKPLDPQVDVVTQATNSTQQTPSLGVTMTDSYLLGDVDVKSAPTDLGSGLLLAIAVYDILTPGELLAGLSVSGTGVVDATGVISGVTAAQQRLLAAEAAGADVFLLPAANCVNVSLDGLGMTVIAVSSLDMAIHDLRLVAAGQPASTVTTCQV